MSDRKLPGPLFLKSALLPESFVRFGIVDLFQILALGCRQRHPKILAAAVSSLIDRLLPIANARPF